MKEIVVTQYMAEDGKVFNTKEKCLAYEEERKQVSELRKAIRKIRQICKDVNCSSCPFNDDCGDCCFPHEPHTPEDWDID